ncbi:MAG: dihydrolipoamide acetyltransferase family protein [Nannocystaceae bacterium]
MMDFKLPEIGEGVVEGEIVQWLKQPGESIDANEALVEVMTDKATIEVPSPVAGVVAGLRAEIGEICAVGQVIAELSLDGSAPVATTPVEPPAVATTPVEQPVPVAQLSVSTPVADTSSAGSVLATPAARALARETGVDLNSLPVDARGRLTKRDVLQANLQVQQKPVATPAASAPRPAAAVPSRPAAPPHSAAPAAEDETIPFRGMRRRIAEGMVRSYTQAVHYTYVEQINVTKLVELRRSAKAAAAEQGVKLTFLPFIVKAVIHALKKVPIANAELDEAGARIIVKKRYCIGVATATPQGLMVPVIHHADRLSILDTAREIARLGEGARTGKCTRNELTGSTFTVSSLGTIGGVLATPIINFPEVGILGVHAIRKTPVVDEHDNITVGHLMNLSVSFDHRVVDGFEAASFLQEVRRFLEDPNLLLLAGI